MLGGTHASTYVRAEAVEVHAAVLREDHKWRPATAQQPEQQVFRTNIGLPESERVVTRDIKAYEAFYLDHLSKLPNVQSINSSVTVTVIKETTILPITL